MTEELRKLKRRWFVRACALGLLSSAMHGAVAGPVIYDNGLPNHVSGNNLGIVRQAEDFSLTAATAISDVHFWSLEQTGTYRGSISWSIMSDAAGKPGAALASGNETSVTRTSLGTVLGLNEFRNDFNFSSAVPLQAGTYWLVLHNGSFSNVDDPNEFLWETTNINATLRGMESFAVPDNWTTNFNEHAFSITAVPEPASCLLLLSGLGMLAVARRRSMRKPSHGEST